MMTDVYQHVRHHDSIESLLDWAAAHDDSPLPVIGVDNLPGSVPIESTELPQRCLLLFGQEGPGLSAAAHAAAEQVCSIAQFGSTRSINAGVAAGIAMHAWVRRWADARLPEARRRRLFDHGDEFLVGRDLHAREVVRVQPADHGLEITEVRRGERDRDHGAINVHCRDATGIEEPLGQLGGRIIGLDLVAHLVGT